MSDVQLALFFPYLPVVVLLIVYFASGADIVTMPTKVFDGMYEHELTDKGMDIFDKHNAKSIAGLEITSV